MTTPPHSARGARDVDIERIEEYLGSRLPPYLRDRLAAENGFGIDDSAGVTGERWTILPVLDRSDRKRMTATAYDMMHASTQARTIDRVSTPGFGEPKPGHPFPASAVVIGHGHSREVRLALMANPDDSSVFGTELHVQRYLLPIAPLGVTIEQFGPDPLAGDTGEALPEFRYHPDPVASGSITRSVNPCIVCGMSRGWRYGPVQHCVCPWCLADGTSGAQLEWTGHPEIEGDVPASVVDEIALRTPWFVTWQGSRWLTHCDDAAAFIAPVGWEELKDKPAALRCLVDDGWPEDTLQHLDPNSGLVAYLFRCLHCREYLAFADAS
ncbi:MAG: CbrC family protein [Rhodoglobus sp.]